MRLQGHALRVRQAVWPWPKSSRGTRKHQRAERAGAGTVAGAEAGSAGTAPIPGQAASRALTGGNPPGAAPPPGQQARTRKQALLTATQPKCTATATTGQAILLAPSVPDAVRESHMNRGRNAAHCAERPLQRQGHPEILSNRSAERISGTRP